jgi:two-component system chemotaxis response regulator CheY|tara:strand:+ start:388 stop:579 length:192 start_codon:yes stop_codon:yes gene_type:complete
LLLAHAQNISFDFLASDWNMAQMQGIDLLKTGRADENLATLPELTIAAETKKTNYRSGQIRCK